MSQITVDNITYGINSIVKENPIFKVGHDGSDGSCDSIGLIRGGLLRAGATKITSMKEPNQFARKIAINLNKNNGIIKRGQVLLKTKDISDETQPLPFKYRNGGSDYNGDLTNYVDIAFVINDNPIEIVYMTNEGAIKNKNINDWDYVCDLPYVSYKRTKSAMMSAIIQNDTPVKLYESPSFSSTEITRIPSNTLVLVNEKGERWSRITYVDKSGYVLSKFIKEESMEVDLLISNEERIELEKAYMILGKVLGYIK